MNSAPSGVNALPSTEERLRAWELAILTVCLALVKIAYSGYRYGSSDMIDHLPIIQRFMDPAYLARDFRVNAAAGFGPRFYYSMVLATLAKVFSLPVVYLALTYLTHAAVILGTALTASRLHRASRTAVLAACVLVLSVDPFQGMDDVVFTYLKPSYLSRAFGYAAILAAFHKRPLAIALLSCMSGFWHPTLAMETGAFALLVVFVTVIAEQKPKEERAVLLNRTVLKILLAGVIMAVYTALFWVIPYRNSLSVFRLDDQRFFQIVLLRTEYTTVPSSFGRRYWAGGVFFLAALAGAWWRWKRTIDRGAALSMIVLVLAIILFCIAGFVFVEILPSRAWVTARAFRMVHVIKWMGLILLAGAFVQDRRWLWRAAVLLATVLFGFVFGGVEIPVLAMGAVVAAVLAASPRIDRTWFRVLAPTVLMAVIATDTLRPFILPRALRASRPVVTMTLQDPIVEYARTQTPQDAVFLTPPNYGLFRLAAQRAIVVDWKSMPFQDEGMLEWWRRMNDCYANVEGMKRKESLLLMERSYAAISTEKLLDLGRRYGAEYAIVDNDDPVSLKVLATNGRYELIRLNDPGSAR